MLPCRRGIQTLDPPLFQWVAHACFVQPPTRQNAPFSQSPTFANIAKMVQMSISSTEPLENKSGKFSNGPKLRISKNYQKLLKVEKLEICKNGKEPEMQNFKILPFCPTLQFSHFTNFSARSENPTTAH